MWVDNQEEQDPYGRAQNNTNLNVGQGGASAATPPSGSNTPQGNPSTISPVQSNQPQQNFATIQDYLGGNKQQGEDLGQKVTSSLTDTQNQEKGAIDTAATQTKNDINSNTVGFDSGLVNKAVNTPTDVANNPNDLNSFLKQWNASYSGPSSFESSSNYADASKAANDATQKAQELSTTGGREQLLQDQFGVYGQGNKGLDQAILQNSSAFPKVQEQANGFNSINDYLATKANEINPLATQAQQTTANTKQATQAPFANALTNFQTGLNSEVSAARNTANSTASQYQADLASGDPTKVQADLQKAGVDPAQSKSITDYLTALNKEYGINPNIPASYISNPATQITPANVATPEEYAKAQALQKLTGVDYGGVLNPADNAQAGKASPTSIDAKSLQDYLKSAIDIQDKSKITSPGTNPTTPGAPLPSLGDFLKSPNDPTVGTNLAKSYTDAFTRQGTTPKGQTFGDLPPQLQTILSQMTGGNPRVADMWNGSIKFGWGDSAGAQSFWNAVKSWQNSFKS